MKDIKYIIKRIIIGTGIALALMFIRQNVYAYEWTTEGDVLVDTSSINTALSTYSARKTFYTSPTYTYNIPISRLGIAQFTGDSIYYNYSNTASYDSGTIVPLLYTGFDIYFPSITFEPDVNYYVIVPFPSSANWFSSMSQNVNEDKMLDSSTYSGSSGVTVSAASFSWNIDNPFNEGTSLIPSIVYWKIFFTVSEEISNIHIYIGDIDTTHTFPVTAYNTYSSNNWLLRTNYNSSCTSFNANRTCYYYTQNRFKPLLYTHIQGSIVPDDGNNVAADISTDIKTQIQQIIDGQFSEDLDFPYLNGGGRTFGDNEYSLQDLLLMPINFIQKLTTDDTCTPLTVPVPGLTGNMQLPCASSFATSILGQQIVDMIKLIIGCILGFKILTALYNSILHIFSPQHLLYVDDIF